MSIMMKLRVCVQFIVLDFLSLSSLASLFGVELRTLFPSQIGKTVKNSEIPLDALSVFDEFCKQKRMLI
jgi:hypothetical protein